MDRIYQAILDGGKAALKAGIPAGELRQALEDGWRAIDAGLARQAFPVEGAEALAGLLRSAGYDEALADELGAIFDLLGPEGRLALRKGSGRSLERVMEEGTLWDGEMAARLMSNSAGSLRAVFENPAILISDLTLTNSEQFVPLVELAEANGIRQMLLICRDLSVQSRSVLITPNFQKRLWVAAVKLPAQAPDLPDMIDDLALLTGGRALRQSQAAELGRLQVEDLGRARQVWADFEGFGIIGGQGDTLAVRTRVAGLREAILASADPEKKRLLRLRLARLINGAVILKVGAETPDRAEQRMEQVAWAAGLLRQALREGVLPGGGAALLACRDALAGVPADDGAAHQAANILAGALETPFRAMLAGAGFDPGPALVEISRCGPGFGFDLQSGQVRDMRAAGTGDVAEATRMALRSAVEHAMGRIEAGEG